ncbi:cation:proton antiporter [Verrucomicrobia bacterium LW23]|nr:cation:proton antiporter [Verrucomicrobia bacterium LW23]
METLIILLAGFLFACGFFLILRRNITQVLIGVLFLSQAANLAILAVSGLGTGISAIVQNGAASPPSGHADPLPQALILTAIVIGFGVFSFAVVLLKKAFRDLGTDDTDHLNKADF